jgi:hypothetical protein
MLNHRNQHGNPRPEPVDNLPVDNGPAATPTCPYTDVTRRFLVKVDAQSRIDRRRP